MSKPESISASGDASQENLLHLSASQLQELQGVLRNPVSGRQVMIPLTSKAFIIGSLQPDKDINGEETLHIRSANRNNDRKEEFEEIPRKILVEQLERERKLKKEAAKQKKASPGSKTTEVKAPSTNASTTSKKAPPSNPKADEKQQTHHHHHHHHARNSGPALPFFEIKEEIDNSGRVLRSEKKDVTKQLELVAKELQVDGESKAEEPEYGDAVDIPTDYSDVEVLNSIDEESNKLKPVTDQDFALLSTRLDDLAKLEEEAEQKTEENLSSAMRIQGKAWNKGFLVGKSAKQRAISKQRQLDETDLKIASKVPLEMAKPAPVTPPQPTSSASTTQPPTLKQPPAKQGTDQGGWSKGFLTSASSSKPAKAVLPSAEPVDGRSRTVKFQANDEVKEIPRIGTQSVPSLRKAHTPISPGLMVADKPSPAPAPAPARSFDSSVFNGIVKERTSGAKSTNSQDAKPKKKLSKFAQDRLQNK